MEYNLLKHMRQKRLPTQPYLTVKFYLAIVLIITLHSRDVLGSTLGSKCQHDMDCTDFIKGSSCSAQGYCECAPYYVQYNTTTCLSSQLLGGDCTLNEQCTMKVANSSCLDGACRCVEGFLQFRKHTCLGPAPPGSVCYSHAHCQMFSARTHCDFLIPNLFGRCQCTAPAKLKAGLCLDNTIEEVYSSVPTASSTTTTSTTSAPVKETEAPLSTTQEQDISSSQQLVSTEPIVEEHQVVPDAPIVQHSLQEPAENSNVSIEEQNWEDDKDIVQPTSKAPFEMEGEPLTPAEVDEHYQHETTESAEAHDIPNATDDYPYKIEEEEEEHTQSHKQENAEEHLQEVPVKEEEHVGDYGDVIDNTMNFDYEAAQHEMEDHLYEETNSEEVEQEPTETPHQEFEAEQQKQEQDSHENHGQESDQNLEQPQVSNHEQEQEYHQVHTMEPEQYSDHPELKPELENTSEHQQEHESQSEEHVEQHKEGHQHEELQEYEPSEYPDLEKIPEESFETEEEQEHKPQKNEHKQENEKEQEQAYDELHEEQENGPVQQHLQHEEFNGFGNDGQQTLEIGQKPGIAHEEVNTSEEGQEYAENQESEYEEELNKTQEPMQVQIPIKNIEPEKFPEQEQSQDHEHQKKQELEQSHESLHEEEPEQSHKPYSEQETEHLENYDEPTEQQPDQEHEIHEPEWEGVDHYGHHQEVEEQYTPEPQDEHQNLHQQPAQEENQDKDQQAIEQQTESIEHYSDEEHAVQQQHVVEQDYIAQLDHKLPGNNEINKIPPKQQQQDNQEESLSESLNLQSITNEIYHDQPDKVATENESVQKENESTTQLSEAAMLANNEVITTQSAVLEENDKNVVKSEDEDNNNNKEVDLENSQEQQQLTAVDETAVSNENIVDNEEEKFVGQQIDQNNTMDQIPDTNVEQQQQKLEILQEATDKMPEVENYTNEYDEENVEEGKQHETSTVLPTKANQLEEETQKPGEEQVKDQIGEQENISEEEVVPNETVIESETEILEPPQYLEENVEEEQKPAEEMTTVQQENDELIQSQAAFEDSKHIENNIEHDVDHIEDVKENQEEINHMENEKDETDQEQHTQETALQSTENIYKQDEGNSDNDENDNLIESTTFSVQDLENEISEQALENIESNQTNEEAEEFLEDSESIKQQEPDHFNESNEQTIQKEQTLAINKEQESIETHHGAQIFDVNNFDAEPMTISADVQQVTEAFETQYVPSKTNEEAEEQFVEREPSEIDHKVEADNQDSASIPDSIEQGESEENVYDNQLENTYFTQDQIPDLVRPENEEFKESESISDILNNLMKEDITLQPEYSEESNFNEHLQSMHESDVPDLLAEDTNISEESVMSEQLPTKDSTQAPIDPEDKLITFYPDMQEMQPVQQLPIISQQQTQQQQDPIEEASGDDENPHLEENEIIRIEEHIGQKEQHTPSPLDLPFDTSVDYEPQQFEADNLVIETTTISASELKLEQDNEQAETTTTASGIDELTTQTMQNLASRVTLMEPAAPISTTLKPLISSSANDEVTAIPSLAAPITESLLTTKPTTEIRKRVELSLEAVSLGLSCSNDKQCQLADPHTICNVRGVCDCAVNIYSAQAQSDPTFAQCGAKKTGCAPGTFQCRSSGVCISWFFVCDGRSDCNDASDEECSFNARLNQTCPSQAFQCARSGRCISRAALCDGRKQCPHGEDEIGCNGLKSDESCPAHTFRCKSGECFPEYEYCNAIISCRDGSDEPPHLCGSRSMPNFFLQLLTAGGLMNPNIDENAYCPHRCNNGRCRSTAIVCSGRDGCGDGTDEQTCSVCRCPAASMDRPAINVSEFLARQRPMPLW